MADLERLLYEAVQNTLAECEGKVGVLVSGGIDSATVACLAPEFPMFTGYYQGEPYDERPYARLVAARFPGREHHELQITPEDFVQHMDTFLEVVQPPYEGPGAFGQYMVARYVTQHVDTVLSGEGGDELFGGYARLHLVAGVSPPDGYEDYVLPDDYPRDLAEALAWEWEVNLPALLALDEQVTRAHGLKARAPMAEYQPLHAHVLALPPRERVGKKALKRAMRGVVPDPILARTDKRGFPVPFVEWAQEDPVKSFVGERIGYIPDPDLPWDRKWWNDLCESQLAFAA